MVGADDATTSAALSESSVSHIPVPTESPSSESSSNSSSVYSSGLQSEPEELSDSESSESGTVVGCGAPAVAGSFRADPQSSGISTSARLTRDEPVEETDCPRLAGDTGEAKGAREFIGVACASAVEGAAFRMTEPCREETGKADGDGETVFTAADISDSGTWKRDQYTVWRDRKRG